MKSVGFGELELDEIMVKGKDYIRRHKKNITTPAKKRIWS